MRIRLTGTRTECERFTAELLAATAPGVIRDVSTFHPNRGTTSLGRVYLDLQIPTTALAGTTPTAPQGSGRDGARC